MRCVSALIPVLALASMGGCLERRISITSEPPGALVILNDIELGLTPVETSFEDFGTYELRVSKHGYEPVVEPKTAYPPPWEWPGVDLFAMALPWTIHTRIKWDVQLEPSPVPGTDEAQEAERALLERAAELRSDLQGTQ